MGYYSQAIAFSLSPDQGILNGILTQYGYSVYQHKIEPFWLIDLLNKGNTLISPYTYSPFTNYCGDDFETELLHSSVLALCSIYTEILSIIQPAQEYGVGWIRLIAHLSTLTEQELFFFAADDELIDFACRARNGEILELQASFESFDIYYHNDRFHIQHIISQEDFFEDEQPEGPHYNESCMVCNRLALITALHLEPFLDADEGRLFYHAPLKIWPKQLGDPVTLLKLGTWDSFSNLEDDFKLMAQKTWKI